MNYQSIKDWVSLGSNDVIKGWVDFGCSNSGAFPYVYFITISSYDKCPKGIDGLITAYHISLNGVAKENKSHLLSLEGYERLPTNHIHALLLSQKELDRHRLAIRFRKLRDWRGRKYIRSNKHGGVWVRRYDPDYPRDDLKSRPNGVVDYIYSEHMPNLHSVAHPNSRACREDRCDLCQFNSENFKLKVKAKLEVKNKILIAA